MNISLIFFGVIEPVEPCGGHIFHPQRAFLSPQEGEILDFPFGWMKWLGDGSVAVRRPKGVPQFWDGQPVGR